MHYIVHLNWDLMTRLLVLWLEKSVESPAFHQLINLAAVVGVLAEVSLTARGEGALQPHVGFNILLRMVDSATLTCLRGYLGSPLEMIWRLQQMAVCSWLPAWGSKPCEHAILCSGC